MEAPYISANASTQQFQAAAANVATKGFGSAGFSLVTEIKKLLPNATASPDNYPVRQFHQLFSLESVETDGEYVLGRFLRLSFGGQRCK
jgi:hypothetical protein